MILSRHISQITRGKKGFTLIELLVVIGIIGILAAGLLAAIDPLEQLRKAQDTSRQKIAVEYYGALTRYYSTYGTMPWGAVAQAGVLLSAVTNTVTATLTNVGELKSSFNQGAGSPALSAITLSGDTASNIYVCFDPVSRSLGAHPTTIYADATAGTSANCPSSGYTTTNCYYCAR